MNCSTYLPVYLSYLHRYDPYRRMQMWSFCSSKGKFSILPQIQMDQFVEHSVKNLDQLPFSNYRSGFLSSIFCSISCSRSKRIQVQLDIYWLLSYYLPCGEICQESRKSINLLLRSLCVGLRNRAGYGQCNMSTISVTEPHIRPEF